MFVFKPWQLKLQDSKSTTKAYLSEMLLGWRVRHWKPRAGSQKRQQLCARSSALRTHVRSKA